MIHAITVNIEFFVGHEISVNFSLCYKSVLHSQCPTDPCQGVCFFFLSLYMLYTCCLFLISVELREIWDNSIKVQISPRRCNLKSWVVASLKHMWVLIGVLISFFQWWFDCELSQLPPIRSVSWIFSSHINPEVDFWQRFKPCENITVRQLAWTSELEFPKEKFQFCSGVSREWK